MVTWVGITPDFVTSSRPSIFRNTHMRASTQVLVIEGPYYQQIDVVAFKVLHYKELSVYLHRLYSSFVLCIPQF